MSCIIRNLLLVMALFDVSISAVFAMDPPPCMSKRDALDELTMPKTYLFEYEGEHEDYDLLSFTAFNEIIPVPESVKNDLGIDVIKDIRTIKIESATALSQGSSSEYLYPIAGKDLAIRYLEHENNEEGSYLSLKEEYSPDSNPNCSANSLDAGPRPRNLFSIY